ncbi:MAG: hypothetical protein B1H09_07700 [Gemmatimonadaceae bacterium 4484_173]|nr:MAG: hypothetical protein B1H09_07700 [Gemmatimonadaceae bacterium 4484_173]
MKKVINRGVFRYFSLLVIGFVIAGFLVPDSAETDDGHPLNIFLWIMGGMFAVSMGAVLLYVNISNRRMESIEQNWYDATAEIIDVSETGTYINNQPRLKFLLRVNYRYSPPAEIVHKQVIPLTSIARFSKGKTIKIKVNPENSEKVLLV